MFTGVQVGSHVVEVTHLQLVDDNIMFGEANSRNVSTIKSLFALFELVSGLRVNLHKSNLFCFNVCGGCLAEATAELQCKTSACLFVYLGMSIGSKQGCKAL
jgi:mannosylglycoprotein endo-beta-mannosidase